MTLSQQWLTQTAAFVVLGSASVAESAPRKDFQIDYTAKCKYQTVDCKGSRTTLSVTSTDQQGRTIYSVTRFTERDKNVVFDESRSLGTIKGVSFGNIHGVSKWDTHGGGYQFSGQREINLTKHAAIRFGAYVGRIEGEINLRSEIDAYIKPVTFKTDPFTIKVYGRQFDIKGYTYNIQGYDRTLWRDVQSANGKTFYGGVTADGGYAYPVNRQFALLGGVHAAAGMDQAAAGFNAGLMYSTDLAHATRTPVGDVCEGHSAFPKRGINVRVDLCLTQVYHDALYEAQYKKVEKFAKGINYSLDRAATAVRYNGSVPHYSAERVLKELGVTSPYQTQSAINISVAKTYDEIGFAGGINIPVGRTDRKLHIYGSLQYSY